MHRRIVATATAILLGLALLPIAAAPSAHGFFGFKIVFDPQNYAQNLMTAARTLQTIRNQVRQLQNEARMLANQAKNLAKLGYDPRLILDQKLQQITQLMDQAKALSFQVSQTDQLFRQRYPEDYANWSKTQKAAAAEAQWQAARSGYHDALLVQSQIVQNVKSDAGLLDTILSESSSASGSLAAQQAGNQLAGLNTKQLMQVQQLMASQHRAQALERARVLQIERQGKIALKDFVGSAAAYTRP
ncbi:MAG: P-type conjugative transfer protein TrbJ [Pseudomonadota bacterium]